MIVIFRAYRLFVSAVLCACFIGGKAAADSPLRIATRPASLPPLPPPTTATSIPSLDSTFASDNPDADMIKEPGDESARDEVADQVVDEEAYEDKDEEPDDDSFDEDVAATLLGERWHQVGAISAEYLYTSEVFNNARGGVRTRGATRYRGNFDLALSLDTEVTDWWQGGEFYVYMHQSHGQTLTNEFVGDTQYYSGLDTSPRQPDVTRLGEYWYRHSFADSFEIKIGRQDPNGDFAYADLGGDFVNSSFLTLPNVALPTWPYQTVGVSSLWQVNEKWRAGGGIYDNGRDIGQWYSTTTTRGLFALGQLDYEPFANDPTAKFTLIRLGTWYTSSDTLAVDASQVFDGNYGVYTTIDRMLATECGDPSQGLGLFAQYSWAPGDRYSIEHHCGGGLVYRGLIEGRDSDTLGLGVTTVLFSSEQEALTDQSQETATELFYKCWLNDWLAIQPDLQFIAEPNGIERNALLLGLRFDIKL